MSQIHLFYLKNAIDASASPRRGRPVWLVLPLILAASSAVFFGNSAAEGQESFINREQEIQAAYLFNYGKYVTWPDNDSAKEFVIGFIGDSSIEEALLKLSRAKTLNGKPIVVREFRAIADYQACHILYVPEGQDPELVDKILQRVQKEPILIVGERRTSAEKAAMICFFPEGNTLRFEIDPHRAERVRLKISSKLLTLGKTVRN